MGGSGYSDTPWHWKCWVGGHGGACEEPIIFIKNIKWWICWMNSTYIFCFTRTCQISAPENYSKLGAEEKRKTKKKHAANSFYLSPSHSVLSLACMWLTGIVNTVYMSRREWHKRLERRFKFFKRRKLPLFLSPTFRFKLLWASLFSRSIHIRTVQNKKNQRMCSFPCWRPSWQPACIILTNVF